MSPERLLAELMPYARLATAIVPFFSALFFRLLTGKSRLATVLLSVAVTWFAVAVLTIPFSFDMQVGLQRVRQLFP